MGPSSKQPVDEIPVYMFLGFLESGKTTFAKETLIDRGFTEGEPTLLLVCEEGEVEYDTELLKKDNIFTEFIDDDNLTTDHLIELQDKYKPTRVLIEYNGTWKMEKLFGMRVPKGWTVVQIISFVNAQTFDLYISNMRQMMNEHLATADMIVFNRCDENTKRGEYRRSIKAINRRAQIIFENKEGVAEMDDTVDLPYDVEQSSIEPEEDDFGIFYIDACDNPERYVGKTVKTKAQVYKPKEYGAKAFVSGRFAMTCCAEDIQFVGIKTYFDAAKHLRDRQWVEVTGVMDKEFYPEFGAEGPIIKASKVEPAKPAEEEVVYFS